MRGAQHEVCARLTDLGAILQESLVLGCSMLAAHRQTVGRGFDTKIVAIHTIRDALPHFGSKFVMMHDWWTIQPGLRFFKTAT
jgi:hypothetical protein